MNFSSFFTIAFLGILGYQLIIGITQYFLNKSKENFFFALYIFCLLVNFIVNFYFWLYPQANSSKLLFIKAFFGLPINFLIQMVFINFVIYFLQLNVRLQKIFQKIFITNFLIFTGTVIYSIFFPNWNTVVNLIINVLNIVMFILPLHLVYKIKNNDSKYVFKGSLALGVSFIFNLIIYFNNLNLFNPDIITMFGVMIEIIYFNFGLQIKLKTQETKLLVAKLEKQKAIEEEHKRVSADLHDDLGSTLSSIQILTLLTQSKINAADIEAKQHITTIQEQTQKMQHNLTDIVWGLRVDLNSIADLQIKLNDILNKTLALLHIDYNIEIDKNIYQIKLSVLQRRSILLIIKEAINNIVKYANATKVVIALSKKDNNLIINIGDIGKGFNLNNINFGNGLKNMQNRALNMNGNFAIESILNKGTTILVSIPIELY